jgi:putative hemolysin
MLFQDAEDEGGTGVIAEDSSSFEDAPCAGPDGEEAEEWSSRW